MTHKKDIDLLIDAHDEAIETRNAAAVTIAEMLLNGEMPSENVMRAYAFARLGVESTARDLENSVTIAATVAAEEA